MRDPWLDWPEELHRAGTALLRLALEEDLGEGDLTARHFAGSEETLTVRLAAREPGRTFPSALAKDRFSTAVKDSTKDKCC